MRHRAGEAASPELIARVLRKGRTIAYASEGTEELRYLDYMNANANVGGGDCTHIILRTDARRIEVLEEFLHGTQWKAQVIQRLGFPLFEVHVKEFMLRHRRLLGLSDEEVAVLNDLLSSSRP